jgi:hypothetical protein
MNINLFSANELVKLVKTMDEHPVGAVLVLVLLTLLIGGAFVLMRGF